VYFVLYFVFFIQIPGYSKLLLGQRQSSIGKTQNGEKKLVFSEIQQKSSTASSQKSR
jgi:hypothetical protein